MKEWLLKIKLDKSESKEWRNESCIIKREYRIV